MVLTQEKIELIRKVLSDEFMTEDEVSKALDIADVFRNKAIEKAEAHGITVYED